jgi:hypothetical protein
LTFKTEKIKEKYLYLAKYIIRNKSANLLPYVSYTNRCNTLLKTRKIRYDLMEKNKTRKYLKAAIREIKLVFTGIHIPMQLNT